MSPKEYLLNTEAKFCLTFMPDSSIASSAETREISSNLHSVIAETSILTLFTLSIALALADLTARLVFSRLLSRSNVLQNFRYKVLFNKLTV